jgi:hypothetical protein
MWNMKIDDMPEEIRVASLKLRAAIERSRHAANQVQLWKREWECAEKAFEAEQANYGAVALRWDTETNTMRERLEEAPEEKPA